MDRKSKPQKHKGENKQVVKFSLIQLLTKKKTQEQKIAESKICRLLNITKLE